MFRRSHFLARLLTALTIVLMLGAPLVECHGRGRGGGGGGARGGGGGGRGGMSGGGMGGGAGRSSGGGGFTGGARPSPASLGGPGRQPNFGGGGAGGFGAGGGRGPGGAGNLGAAGIGAGGRGGRTPGADGFPGASRAGGLGAAGAGGPGGRGLAGQGQASAANRFSTPSRGQLDSFLGLPSDGGMHSPGSARATTGAAGFGGAEGGFRSATAASGGRGVNPFAASEGGSGLGASTRSTPSQLPAGGGNFDVNYGSTEGPRGGQVGGISVSGPQGNTAGRVVGVGPQGGAATVGGVQGAGGGAAARGVAVGPGGQVAAGSAVRGPAGGAAARGVTTGPRGTAAGFARVTPSGRYTCAAAVRGNYNHWGIYGTGWYTTHPGAWYAAGWAASSIWNACTWSSAASYCGYYESPPVYYDYGNNVTYEDGSVYMNGDNVGTAEEYYNQAADLATAGAQADAPPEGDWLPLGVFALTRPDQTDSIVTIQLAINKQGIIRGNYTDTKTDETQIIQGSVDKETQRVAFSVGDNKSNYIETGLYNLTKDEAPALIHVGKERTEQWLLVRLDKPSDSNE